MIRIRAAKAFCVRPFLSFSRAYMWLSAFSQSRTGRTREKDLINNIIRRPRAREIVYVPRERGDARLAAFSLRDARGCISVRLNM